MPAYSVTCLIRVDHPLPLGIIQYKCKSLVVSFSLLFLTFFCSCSSVSIAVININIGPLFFHFHGKQMELWNRPFETENAFFYINLINSASCKKYGQVQSNVKLILSSKYAPTIAEVQYGMETFVSPTVHTEVLGILV